jgi:plasmid stabilization system protein ParE
MTHAVTLLDAAKADLAEAASWYRDCHPGLDADFLLCVEETLDRVARYPIASPRVHGEFRRAVVHRFPFGVIYRVARGQVFVVAVLHTSRDPRIWQARGH